MVLEHFRVEPQLSIDHRLWRSNVSDARPDQPSVTHPELVRVGHQELQDFEHAHVGGRAATLASDGVLDRKWTDFWDFKLRAAEWGQAQLLPEV